MKEKFDIEFMASWIIIAQSRWIARHLEISSFETGARMVFLAIGGFDIVEGVFDFVGGGGD